MNLHSVGNGYVAPKRSFPRFPLMLEDQRKGAGEIRGVGSSQKSFGGISRNHPDRA